MQAAIKRWQRDPLDTGSGEVQVAILTVRIKHLAEHMQGHHKDKVTKRTLSILVSARNKMLKYLRRKQRDKYNMIIEGLGIRVTKAFDPTIQPHHRGSTTSWAAKGVKYTPKKRKKRALPYGEAKSPKGRTRLVKHAVRQRRLLKTRNRAAERQRLRDVQAAGAAAASNSGDSEGKD